MTQKWTYRGYEVQVAGDGSFYTVVDEERITAESLKLLRDRIDQAHSDQKRSLGLAVVVVTEDRNNDEVPHGICDGKLRGFSRTSRNLLVDGIPKGFTAERVAPDTPANRQVLQEYVDARKAFMDADERVRGIILTVPGFGRVNGEPQYDELLKQLEEQYQERSMLTPKVKSRKK